MLITTVYLSAQDVSYNSKLAVTTEDIHIEQRGDGGFHLFIRKKPELESVLLAESTRDPALQADNYTYRVLEWNEINGDEIRVLNGAPLTGSKMLGWSIIDSTPEAYPAFGEAFHLYVPYILNYGYENTRHGEIYVRDGVYFNLRTFALPYADYRGEFRDNPFVLQVTQRTPEEVPDGNFMPDTVDSFREIVDAGHGMLVWSTGPDDLVDKIRVIMEREKGKSLDLVLCLDTTGSMKKYIAAVRRMLIPLLQGIIGEFADFRVGMVLYKDYRDTYLTRVVPFTKDFPAFQRILNGITTSGGGADIPEAVYEALYDGAVKFAWEAPSRLMILIGDAPPHPVPKGKITKEIVDQSIAERNITVYAIILQMSS